MKDREDILANIIVGFMVMAVLTLFAFALI
jgi:hypothetical protein